MVYNTYMEYEIIFSSRKTLSIEVNQDGQVLVRAPKRMSKRTIAKYVAQKEEWIKRAIERQKSRKSLSPTPTKLSAEEINTLKNKARKVIPEKVSYYAPLVGVSFNRITIRNQSTRWGSCSAKGNLNFNCKLMLLDDELIDYVVVHELCHILQMNHSTAFWAEVERVLPDYKARRKALKTANTL